VLAFDMPPRHAKSAVTEPVLLTTVEEKKAILHALGVDQVEILRFTPSIARLTPEEFFKQVVVDRYRAVEMVVGPRVAFGRNRKGRLPELRALGKKYGVRITLVLTVKAKKTSVASRRLRRRIAQGNIEEAALALGYSYSATGEVIRGDGRGKKLGYPTANIKLDPLKIVPPGVYWVKVSDAQSSFPLRRISKGHSDGICNVGTRPTFDGRSTKVWCEVHVFGGLQNLYGQRLRLQFIRKVRSEKRFPSLEALVRQIKKDVVTVRRWAGRISLQK
jgi:riboflavin kinase/FMN adenylyltransferase